MNSFRIYDEKWDILIILDACRFDYFERQYQEYFSGNLESRISSGSETPEWRDHNFTEKKNDVIYISSNPFIGDSNAYNFCGNSFFKKVISVWKNQWNTELGTVLPENITDTAISVVNNNPNTRFIIHYLQPHAPYISDTTSRGFADPNTTEFFHTIVNISEVCSRRKFKLYQKCVAIAKKLRILGNQPGWRIGRWLGLPPQTPMDVVRRKYGVKKLRSFYSDNLDRVFKEVCLLLDNIETSGKRIIISSDHGELLGENNMFAHSANSDNELLRKVPWFEWNKNLFKPDHSRTICKPTEADQDEISIADKLKDLGYL